MRLIRMLLVSALAFSSLSVHADDKDVARLTQLLEKSQTLTARFSQLTLDGSGTQLQETAGQMALQRPGLFNWHTDAPQEQLMVSDGKKVSLWDPDLEQVTIKTLDQRLTQTPALLLSGDVSKISQSFDISAKEAGDVIDFVLKPKTRDTLFDSLRLSFRKGVINDMQLIDSVGQRTNIQFKFDIPKGADVIQE
jgi:outer membrane lipoprotein carrier protein